MSIFNKNVMYTVWEIIIINIMKKFAYIYTQRPQMISDTNHVYN